MASRGSPGKPYSRRVLVRRLVVAVPVALGLAGAAVGLAPFHVPTVHGPAFDCGNALFPDIDLPTLEPRTGFEPRLAALQAGCDRGASSRETWATTLLLAAGTFLAPVAAASEDGDAHLQASTSRVSRAAVNGRPTSR